MRFYELKKIISADLYRYEGRVSKKIFLMHLRRNPGFKYTVFMRICNFYLVNKNKNIVSKIFFFLARQLLTQFRYKYGIDIPYSTNVEKGLYIGHFGCIFVSPDVKIGKNLNISQGVTIGQSSRGIRAGCPSLGDNVYIGPGAKIIGAIRVGDNVAIGSNCVVTKDVPDNAVVVGIPGKVISYEGSEGYVLNSDYDCLIS